MGRHHNAASAPSQRGVVAAVVAGAIGMGEADTKALRTISAATGGTSYTANTSDDLLTVFVQALLAREPAQAP